MSNQGKDPKCQFWCWAIAAIFGVFIFIILQSIAGKSFIAALILGLIAFGLLGLLFNWLFCAPVPQMGEGKKPSAASASTVGAAAAGGAVAAAAASSASASSTASKSDATPAASTATAASSSSASTTASEASGTVAATSAAPASDVATASDVKTPEAADASAPVAPAKAAPKAKAKAAPKAKAEPKAKAAPKAKAKAAPKAKASAVKAPAKTASKAKAKPAAKVEATPDFDGDGKLEGANEGKKPKLMKAARKGGADDLKRIKGIGPKLEGVCNSMGVFHFDQIAAWKAEELAWVNANLVGFKGRATRDNWIEQAKTLAAGGETEFSKRVDKGSVY